MFDVIVVGARCAGSPTAMLLARKGYRVLLVDRATFPSDTFRNHILLQPALTRLKRWGLLDKVSATNCPPITRFTQDMGDFPLTGNLMMMDDIEGVYAPRRKYLDHILVRAAVEAGAELREGFTVQDLVWDDDRMVGITGRTHGGASQRIAAPIVIGADGLHSIVAQLVNAPTYAEQSALTWVYYSYWRGTGISSLEFYRRDDIAVLGFPTNDGLACVVAAGPAHGFNAFRNVYENNFLEALEINRAFAERVKSGVRAERYVGTADLPNFFRKPYGPGWALVGDAGYHKDPITASGIGDAFRDAELLAHAVDLGLSGMQTMQEALANYERVRNNVSAAMYKATCQSATFGPLPADTLQLRKMLHGNQADTDRYFGVLVGSVSPTEFYTAENIDRISANATSPAPVFVGDNANRVAA